MFGQTVTSQPCFTYPSQQPSLSSMFDELNVPTRGPPSPYAADQGRPASTGPSTGNFCGNFYQPFGTRVRMDIPTEKSLFLSPKRFPHIHRSLYFVHSAKSSIYSSTFFGPKKFYGDEFDFKKEPLHPQDRRRIRFGLKSVVDLSSRWTCKT